MTETCLGCGQVTPGSRIGGEWICKPCRKKWWDGTCSDCGAKGNVIAHGFDWVCDRCRKTRKERAHEVARVQKRARKAGVATAGRPRALFKIGQRPAPRKAPKPAALDLTPWRQASFTDQEAHAWSKSRFGPRAARAWSDAGFTAVRARSWHDSGFSTADAKLWAAEQFAPQQAAGWREACGDAHTAKAFVDKGLAFNTAKVLCAAGFTPDVAIQWIDAGLELADAAAYFKEGKTLRQAVAAQKAAVRAKEREEAAQREAEAAEALRRQNELRQAQEAAEQERQQQRQAKAEQRAAAKAALEHQREDARRELAGEPVPAEATRATPDGLFGSPRTAAALKTWSANLGLAAPGPHLLDRLGKDLDHISLERWDGSGPKRINVADVHSIRAVITSTAGDRATPWAATVRQLLYSAATYLVRPEEVDLYLSGEPLAPDLAADIKLPWPHVVVLFGADFYLSPSRLALLPHSTATPDNTLPYDRYLSAARDLALFGVVIVANPEDRPHDHVAWLIRVGTTTRHYRILVPGHRSRSPLGPLVGNVDAAVCWAGWDPTDDSPPRARAARQPRRRQAAVRAGAGGERAIPIGKGRRARNLNPAPGVARAAHQRRGHWRRQRIGNREDWHYEPRWIRPTIVGALLGDAPGRVYRIDW